jgi:dCTP diphosphatase
MTCEEITRRILKFRDVRDWKQFHNPKDMAIAISLEAGELLEHFLWKSAEESEAICAEKRPHVQDEMADIAIYLFELADNLGIDLLSAMEQKLERNEIKYPVSKSKGKNTKYTDF